MLTSKYLALTFTLPLLISLPLEAQKNRKGKKGKKTQSARAKALTPEEQLKTFTLPEGFTIELVASEENGVINPIDLNFDDAGRLWTNTAVMYPLDPNSKLVGRKSLEALDQGSLGKQSEFKRISDLYKLKTRGKDKIIIIPDPTKKLKGSADVFAEGMTIPQSILPYKNGAFVAHGSEMLYLEDKDGDGKMDGYKTTLTGFGFTDSHTLSHTLVRGPGGWVHFSHGALNKGKVTAVKSGNSTQINYSKIARFSLDGDHIEVVNNGLQNIWGFNLKANGQWYGTEANDLFYSLVPMHPFMGYPGIGNDKIRPYQPFAAEFHDFKVNGTGISGLAYDENGKSGFPAKWKNVGFLANPITSTINSVIADREADGSVISKHLPDFLSCSDDWFRPVNIEFGPDGCLYIVDWYNKIVSHNEVSRDHPDRDRSLGRIWRIRHESQKVRPTPNVLKASDEDLIQHLKAEIQWEKRAAWHQIADRNATALVPQLIEIAKSHSETLDTRVLALWSLESLRAFDIDLMKSLVADKDPDMRREAVRSLNTFKPSMQDLVTLTKPLIDDPHYMVKEQVLRTLEAVGVASPETIGMLVSSANPAKLGRKNARGKYVLNFGGDYENNFQRFLALKALEQYPTELQSFLNSPQAKQVSSLQLTQAAQALPVSVRTDHILADLKKGGGQLSGDALIALSESFSEPKVIKALESFLPTKSFIQLALDHQQSLRSSALVKALTPGLKRLILSESVEDQNLAIETAIRFQSDAINQEIVQLVGAKPLSEITAMMIKALTISPKMNIKLLQKIGLDSSIALTHRVEAVLSLTLVNRKLGASSYRQLYQSVKEAERTSLVLATSYSEQGCSLLLELVAQKLLPKKSLGLQTLNRMIESNPRNPVAKSLVKYSKELRNRENKAADAKVLEYIKATKTLKGNPQVGEAWFKTCVQCHQVGNEGFDIAPSLDGSSNRNIDHLLVAIVKPNVAMEGGYRLYRVTKKSGDILEGYMYSSTKYGTTIAQPGGLKTFIAKEQIKRERFINGQSFMPSTFGSYPAQTMADLVAYIKTIK